MKTTWYLVVEPICINSVIKVYKLEEVAERRKRAFADMVSVPRGVSPSKVLMQD